MADNDKIPVLSIATAGSRLSKRWENTEMTWEELVRRCRETTRTRETVAEYTRMSKEAQSNIKDTGGFVGGYIAGNRRKADLVKWRSVATLDIDYGTPDVWETFTAKFKFAAMLYSTHKHTPEKPRYRLVFPFDRPVNPDEYEPICRKIAEKIGTDLFDDTTYQTARMFFWPSTSRDGEYVFRVQEGEPCNADDILAQYKNYKDAAEWPVSGRENEIIVRERKKQEDPLEKSGLIGAFCREYTIEEAIETFLGDVYEKTAHEDRYTYKAGSVAAGLVCYDGKFAYSNHETDPASKQLCNAFDLCRIHLFGNKDEDSKTQDTTKKPSYQAMQDFVAQDGRVKQRLARERKEEAGRDFADCTDGAEEDTVWMEKLQYDRKGEVKPTARNIKTILENDPELKDKMWQNLFSGFVCVDGGLPWNKEAKTWGNNDDANLRVYLEDNYGLTGKDKIKDSFVAVVTKRRKHPIREYLERLKWDGTPRLGRLITDYIGAEDTELNRMITLKHFTAAVARVMNPGCKYDYCLILTGKEGIGKSTLFSIMGGEWFSDSLVTMEGTKGMEQVRNSWIIELGELGSMKRTDVEQVKAYISRQVDMYRPAYGTVIEQYPRQCVFCGTTNEEYFLKGDTGNRRFWVIRVDDSYRKVEDLKAALEADRDQLWAEAVQRWKDGEKLYLPKELETGIRQIQEEHNDDADDPIPGMIDEFLSIKLPVDWYAWDINRRRAYIRNPDPLDATGTETRTRVCAQEFLTEYLGYDKGNPNTKYMGRKFNRYMEAKTKEWEKCKIIIAGYGQQRAWGTKAAVRPEKLSLFCPEGESVIIKGLKINKK